MREPGALSKAKLANGTQSREVDSIASDCRIEVTVVTRVSCEAKQKKDGVGGGREEDAAGGEGDRRCNAAVETTALRMNWRTE